MINRRMRYEIMKDNFEFRSINPDEVEQAIAIEQICFPPNEACSPKAMTERIAKVPQLFLVAVDKSTGKLAGFLNGVATDEEKFRDETAVYRSARRGSPALARGCGRRRWTP